MPDQAAHRVLALRPALDRFRAHRPALAGLGLFAALLLLSLAGGRLWVWGHAEITPEFSTPPSLAHPFGTDSIGHDTLALVLRGAQKSVQIALLVAALSVTFGAVVGAVAGWYRGLADALLMRLTDATVAIPQIALLVVLSGLYGGREGGWPPGWVMVAAAIATCAWTTVARVVRAEVMSLREREFVDAARALGASGPRIILTHLLPNTAGVIITNATMVIAFAILAESALSYLGVGVRPPDTSLGRLVQDGQQAATTRPWLFYFPGLFIVLTVLSVNLIGDGLREALDPRAKARP